VRHHGQMTVIVRSATPADSALLAEVAAVTFPLACPPGSSLTDIARVVTTTLSEDAFSRYLADDSRTVLLAVDPATTGALGYSMLVAGDPADADVAAAVASRPTVELSKFYVMPQGHGTGAASTLMAATLDAAGATGASSVWLGVNQQNDRALRFYAKHGLERVGTRTFALGDDPQADFVLERRL
jgi:ribosomal protein S18 acetylase RimI-like enzyme